MKVAICDDERMNAEKTGELIEAYSEENCIDIDVYYFSTCEEMLFDGMNFDIAFLEAKNMGNMNGIELGKALRAINPRIMLIYITDKLEYLDDAFSINAIRFFKKPVDSVRFAKAVSEAINRLESSTLSVFLNDESKQKRIYKSDIIFIEIENRKTKIVTADKIYYSTDTITSWREKLVGRYFATPHKSYIVNLDFVTVYERNKYILLNENYNIAIARTRGTEFHKKFSKYKSFQ